MKTQIKNFGLKDLIRCTSVAGWVLLSRPVLYFIFARRRDTAEYATVDLSAMVFILYAFIALIVGVTSLYRSEPKFGNTMLWKSPLVIFVVYTLYGAASMLWSVNPLLTGFRAFECLATALLIVAVIQDLFETTDLEFVILWSLMYCTWDILWAVGRTMQWAESFSQLLESSQMFATTFFFMALYFTPRKWYNYLILIMAIFSMSTVAYIGMGLGLISMLWKKGRTRILGIFGCAVLLVALVGIGPETILKNTIFFDKQSVSLTETTGRNYLMDVTIESVGENPYGLGFFAAEPYVFYQKGLTAISAHNSLFSAAMGLGIPGAILIGLFFLSVGWIVFSRYEDPKYKPILIGCFCVAFLHCMGNPSVGTRVFGAWIPCMYIFTLICGMYVYGKHYELGVKEDYEDNVDN